MVIVPFTSRTRSCIGETEPRTLHRLFGVEALAGVMDCQLDFAGVNFQINSNPICPAVFHRIVQCFL